MEERAEIHLADECEIWAHVPEGGSTNGGFYLGVAASENMSAAVIHNTLASSEKKEAGSAAAGGDVGIQAKTEAVAGNTLPL